MDKGKMIAAVVERLKIRLDEDDPAFVLVELNRLALEETVAQLLDQFDGTLSKIAAVRDGFAESGQASAQQVGEKTAEVIAATERLFKLCAEMAEATKRQLATSTKLAKDEFSNQLQTVTQQVAIEAVREGVTAEIKETAKQTKAAVVALQNAAEKRSDSTTRTVLLSTVLSLLAAGTVAAAMTYLKPSSQLTEEQKQLVARGEVLSQIYPSLDKKSQIKINQLLKENSR